jgi:hypothetical protein
MGSIQPFSGARNPQAVRHDMHGSQASIPVTVTRLLAPEIVCFPCPRVDAGKVELDGAQYAGFRLPFSISQVGHHTGGVQSVSLQAWAPWPVSGVASHGRLAERPAADDLRLKTLINSESAGAAARAFPLQA